MPGTVPPVRLRLEPHAIPTVRAAIEEALAELAYQLIRLRRAGVIPEPWLGDPVSAWILDYYNAHVMDAPESVFEMVRRVCVIITVDWSTVNRWHGARATHRT